jgi:hypothetical protein
LGGVKNVFLKKLTFDCSLSFAAAKARHVDIADQRHRDVSIGADASMGGEIRCPIYRDLELIAWT